MDYIDYTQNITEFPSRKIPQVWNPNSIQELKKILCSAREENRKVYPISTGHNWGLGSKLPVADADLIVLSKLNDIVEVNEELAYARIQPGVTQLQLSEYLSKNHPSLILNVTGGSSHSSVLANAIERGSGKNGQRANDIRQLKVMLASGEEVFTGFGNMTSSSSTPCFYKYGLGPDLTHLFTQSNYGIVTEGVINLLHKQPFTLFLISLESEDLGDFLKGFSKLVRSGVIDNSLEIDSLNDPKIFELFEKKAIQKGWICWFSVYGEEVIRSAKTDVINESLNPLCKEIKLYSSIDNHEDAPSPVQVRMERYNGIPTDHSLISTAKAFGVELDANNPDIDLHKQIPGFRCVLPVIPFSKQGADIIDFIKRFSADRNQEPAISMIALDKYAIEVFVRVYFNRTDESQIATADLWAKNLLIALKERNIFPYRLDIENMNFFLSNANDPLLNLKKDIKKRLDPQEVISPGRYQMII